MQEIVRRAAIAAETGIGRHRILTGDCLEVLPLVDAGSVDVVVTSPPYNIGLKYNSYDDGAARPAYLAWLAEVGRALARVMTDDGSLFLNISGTASDPWIAQDAAAALRDVLVLQNDIVWVKSIAIEDESVGHFKPVNSRRFLNQTHEHVFHFTKTGAVALDRLAVGVPFKDKSNIARWGHAADRRCAGNVWFVPYRTIHSKKQRHHHPSPFPVALAERCIRLHGRTDALVLDPFLGIGSTLLAAEALGHRGIGIEIDPVYAASAAERLAAATGA